MADIESLELRITSDSKDAKAGLDALITTLDTLKTKTKGGVGLTSVANQVGNLAKAAGALNGSEGAKLESLTKGLNALSTLGKLKLSSSIANQISAMGKAVGNLAGVDYSKVGELTGAVQPLVTLGKSNLGSVLNPLKKLPEIMAGLGKVDMAAFASKIKEVTAALKPLADEMQKVANGFSAFPAKIRKFLESSSKVPAGNASSSKSFANLATRVTATVYAFKRGARVIASWINKSSEYTENLNLFTVAMGQYAGTAMEYANSVSEAMGIDTSDWIRNQGVFMTLATGFGSVGERAATMSQQLTQLGYDLSSYYNISVEEAMQKLKSGFAGELEPLRNLGYDLSQAKLEAVALGRGIDKAVSSMNQAEKAELRYYAIMTQVTQVQGDMARTLGEPANQLRILQAQLQMAARALGNIFIPALNAVLPYAIAAVKVIRLLANAVASLVGFTMPEVDYSSFSNAGAGAEQISNGLKEATSNAKKLNQTMLGIDELNVVSNSSSGSGGSNIGGAGFDFELPTYDFIGEATNSRVNEIVEKMKEWLGITGEINSWSDLFDTRLGTILKLVGSIGVGLLAWKLTKGFLDGIATLKALLASPSYSIAIGAILTLTGFTIAFEGMEDAIKNGLNGFNFAEIIGGSLFGAGGAAVLGKTIVTWIGQVGGPKVAFALAEMGRNLGVSTTAGLGAALGASIAGIVLGIPTYFVGIYDAIKNGIDWLSALLIPAGASAASAGIGAIIGMLGGPIGAGIGALIGLAVGLVTDLVILIVQKWESITAWCSKASADIGKFFTNLWNSIVSVWKNVSTWFNTNVIKPVIAFFKSMWNSIKSAATTAWSGIKTVYAAVKTWFNTNVIQPVLKFFKNLWTSISNAASTCWNAIVKFFTPAVNWFSKLFGSIKKTISDIFYNIGVIASGCWQIIKAAWAVASQWFNTKVVQPVRTFFTNLWNSIKSAATTAWNGIKSVYTVVKTWFNTNVIQPVRNFFTNLWNGIKTTAATAWNGIKTVAVNAWNGIKSVYTTVKTWFTTTIFQPLSNTFSNLWNGFTNAAKNAWAGVKSVFSAVGSFFQTTFQNAWAGIVRVFSTAGTIFVNIKDAIVTAFKSIVNSIIRGLNNVIAVPFNGINAALDKIKNIKILGLTPFSSLRSIYVPVIPQLAQGGVVDAGQLFVAREAGAELVGNVGSKTAVMNNDQIVESVSQGVYQAVVAAMRASGSSEGGAQSVNVYLDGKQVYASIEQHRKERGASLMGNQVYSYSY